MTKHYLKVLIEPTHYAFISVPIIRQKNAKSTRCLYRFWFFL